MSMLPAAPQILKTRTLESIMNDELLFQHPVPAANPPNRYPQRPEGLIPLPEAPPAWLQRLLRERNLPHPLPWAEILDGSCYYPCSGDDTQPLTYFSRQIAAFIFSDYWEKGFDRHLGSRAGPADFLRAMQQAPPRGYTLVAHQMVSLASLREIAPTPSLPTHGDGLPEWTSPYDSTSLRDNGFAFYPLQELYQNPPRWLNSLGLFVTLWERDAQLDGQHGLPGLLLIHTQCESNYLYHLLYRSFGVLPELLYLKRPGDGMGGNFMNFGRGLNDAQRLADPFSESVARHPRGLPRWLMDWGLYYPPKDNDVGQMKGFYSDPLWVRKTPPALGDALYLKKCLDPMPKIPPLERQSR